jgi:DNA-binding XRE family transcriptional regulator
VRGAVCGVGSKPEALHKSDLRENPRPMRARTVWRRFRKSKKLSLRQMALALGITVRAVIYIEAGRNEPSYKTREKFRELVERHENANRKSLPNR